MPKQSEPARTVIRCGDGKVGMVVQIAMTLHDAVSVLRVYAQQGREVHAPPGCGMRQRAVPGTGFIVAFTKPDGMDPAALAIWHGREAEALAQLDEDGPVMVLGGAEKVLTLARAVLDPERRAG